MLEIFGKVFEKFFEFDSVTLGKGEKKALCVAFESLGTITCVSTTDRRHVGKNESIRSMSGFSLSIILPKRERITRPTLL